MPDSDNEKNNKTTVDSPSTTTPKYNKARRRLLATLGTGGAIGAAASGWVSPAIESVVLPAHAQASEVVEPSCTDISGFGAWRYRVNSISGGDADSSLVFTDASTHDIDISLSDSDTDRASGFGNASMEWNFNVESVFHDFIVKLNGKWASDPSSIDFGSGTEGYAIFYLNIHGTDGTLVDGDAGDANYGDAGATITFTSGDCTQAYNVTVHP